MEKVWKADENDRAIIAALRADARRSLKALSRATGLRPSTIHERIRRMLAAGAIRYTVRVDEEMMENNFVVFMLVAGSLERYLEKEALSDACVEEAVGVTGDYDILLKLRFRNMREFTSYLIRFRERYAGKISKTVTMVRTAAVKD